MRKLRFVMFVGLASAAIGACQAPPGAGEETSDELFSGPCLKMDACAGYPEGSQCHEYDAIVAGKKMRAAACLPADKIVYRSATCKDVNPCDCVDVVAQCQPTQLCAPLLGDTEMNKVQCFTPLPGPGQAPPAPIGGSGSSVPPGNNPGPAGNSAGSPKPPELELCPAGELPDTADTRRTPDSPSMDPRSNPAPAPRQPAPPAGPAPAPSLALEAACLCDARTAAARSSCTKCPTCGPGTVCQLIEDDEGQAVAKCLPPAAAAPTGGPQTGGAPTSGPQSGAPTGGPQTGGTPTGGPQTGGPQMGGSQSGAPTSGPQTGGPQTGGPQMGASKGLICVANSTHPRCGVCKLCRSTDACLVKSDKDAKGECVTPAAAETLRLSGAAERAR